MEPSETPEDRKRRLKYEWRLKNIDECRRRARERSRRLREDPEMREKINARRRAERDDPDKAEIVRKKGREYAKRRRLDPVLGEKDREICRSRYRSKHSTRLKIYKSAAEKRNHAWELLDEQAMELFDKVCFYCGEVPGAKQLNGIDRRDNTLGYTTQNSVACCGSCNVMKHKLSAEEFIAKCSKISMFHAQK